MSKILYDELLKYKRLVKRYSDFCEDWFVFGNGIYLSRTTINRYKTNYFKKLNEGKKETGYYFTRKGNNSIDTDIDFDYDRGEKMDDKYIRKLNEFNNIFDYERIQELFENVMKIREKVNATDNFEYMKNLNYDVDVKQELKDQYGKYLYC